MTNETKQARDDFLFHIAEMVQYWDSLPALTSREKCEGVAFSMLATLDGVSGNCGGFVVVPDDGLGEDIAGGLHELIHDYFKKFR